jgi:peptidoglycan/LPS O-acetylase OafA/YrhL
MQHRGAGYRADIDGLRAVAVLSIILFHISKTVLPGGFVGVDVFFVISGFLITGNILRDLDAGRFSLLEFYSRRVRRIAPALMVVVLVTVVAGQFLLRPQDAERAAESGGWALASLANVYFWLFQDTSYFAAASAEEPLLHLWSLGVEEQFYLIWPLALMATAPAARVVWLGVAALAGLSFTAGQWLYPLDASFVYYMLPSRAGELLTGALVVVLFRYWHGLRLPDATRVQIAVVGLLLILGSLVYLSEDVVFPGFAAIPPTFGTALLIVAGSERGNPVSKALANPAMVWVGRVSYSAYLWHWPVLAFYRYGHADVGPLAGLVLFGAILGAAWLSFRFVELPCREVKMTPWRTILTQYAAPAAAICALALAVTKTDGLGLRWWATEYRVLLAAEQQRTLPAFRFDYVCQSNRLNERDVSDKRCVLGAESANRGAEALMWGDSNASHFVGMVATFGRAAGFRFRNVEVGSCPPLLSDPVQHVTASRLADCRHSLGLVRPLIESAPVVLIAANWPSYLDGEKRFLDAFFDTARDLAAQGKKIVLIGKAPVIPGYDRRCPEKALSYPLLRCDPMEAPPSAEIAAVNEQLRSFAASTPGVSFFDVTPFLCSPEACRSTEENGEPRYYDSGHLTLAASWRLGERILRQGGVPQPFKWAAGALNGRAGV